MIVVCLPFVYLFEAKGRFADGVRSVIVWTFLILTVLGIGILIIKWAIIIVIIVIGLFEKIFI